MILYDTHAHLYLEEFDADRTKAMERAKEANVHRIFLPNIDSSTTVRLHQFCAQFPDSCFPMMGLHPCSVKENYPEELDFVEKNLRERKYIAVGEIGIDLYHDKTYINEQKEAFRRQAMWAKECGLPVVIHVRDSFDEVFHILEEINDDSLRGIFHCFTGTQEQAGKIISLGGFKLGIGGVVTFKNGGLDKTLPGIDISNLVLETDSPYLAPAPYRGKRNEPAYIKCVAEKLAEIYKISVEEVADITTKNAVEVFML